MSHSFPARPRVRHALGCSAIALAAALAAPASAQSFQGTANITFGDVGVFEGSGTTDISISTSTAVIDWTPNDTAISAGTPINWQPAGTTATFTSSIGDFAILNRIVPTDTSRPIVFSGTVISQILASPAPVRGGTVFFYSPGGIVLSSSAVFDVGNLGLTTAPPVVDGNGGWYIGNTVQFDPSVSGRAITIQPGAQINAPVENSYVAAFAPRIEQSGTIAVNGQAALVAGEAGRITFSPDGLFDIEVTLGTDETFAIDHRGTTTGPASSGAGDNHRVYMVAIPKNNAMQLAITRGSSVGFDVAGAADVQGNTVVLTAGYNVTNGVANSAPSGGTGEAQININDSNLSQPGTGIDFTSAVEANSSGRLDLQVFRQTNFASNALLRANTLSQAIVSSLPAESTGALSVAGNLTISANRPIPTPGSTGDAGTALLVVTDGGTIAVGGLGTITATASTDHSADGVSTGGIAQIQVGAGSALTITGGLRVDTSAFTDGVAGAPDARGGNSQISLISGGTASIGGVTRLLSYGIAGLNNGSSGQGGDGFGGTAAISLSGGSAFTANELNIAADGVGGADAGAGAGNATGGTAAISVSGANTRFTVQSGNLTGIGNQGELDFLSAEAFAGQTSFANGTSGNGVGGSALISASAGAQLALPADTGPNLLRILGRAYGGTVVAGTANATGGTATGGDVSIFLDNATLTGGALLPSSFAQGGGSTAPALATSVINGGNAVGGTREIAIVNGSTFSAQVSGGGPGAQGGAGSASGRGGDGTGGTARTLVDASTLNVPVGGFITFTQNTSGTGAIYGATSGGVTDVTIRNGALVNLANGANFLVSSNNFSDLAPFAAPAQSGGNVTAGAAVLRVEDSRILGAGQVTVAANATVQHGTLAGGNATAGSALLEVTGGQVDVASLTVSADAFGAGTTNGSSAFTGATGGSGTGGQASVILRDAALTIPSIEISANGAGGLFSAPGATGLTGGAATGGSAVLRGESGTNSITTSDIRIDATGDGGSVEGGVGSGGAGTGGTALLRVVAGTLSIGATSVIVGADGSGGNGGGGAGDTGSNGGLGTGGNGQLIVEANAGLTVTGDLEVSGEGRGGDAVAFDLNDEIFGIGIGGEARGGSALALVATGGQLAITGNVDFDGEDEGGAGLTGGLATAGESVLHANGGAIQISGALNIDRSAIGGDGNVGGNALGSTAASNSDAFMLADNGGAIAVGGLTVISTTISGGDAFDPTTGGTGGSATGGRAQAFANAATIDFGNGVFVISSAEGGDAAIGGAATAGVSYLQSAFGGSILVTGDASVRTDATAGIYFGNTATGGAATGGEARIFATDGGASLAITGDAFVASAASGGTGARDAAGNGGPGGAAVAGSAGISAVNGAGNTVTITGGAFVDVSAFGGTGLSVSGGNATGGLGFVSAGDGGAVTVGGDIEIASDAFGGTVDSFADLGAPLGTRGGDAIGGRAELNVFGTGGTLNIGGNVSLNAFAFGGTVFNPVGDGGDATAGFATIFARNGSISILGLFEGTSDTSGGSGNIGGDTLTAANEFTEAGILAENGSVDIGGQTFLAVSASGGDGRNGGAGGSAIAGEAIIDANTDIATGVSTITLSDLFVFSEATGGSSAAVLGQAGGAGGSATSGAIQAFGTAGNGTLVVTGASQFISAAVGGDGGSSDTGAGGAGGAATSGYIQFGTRSGDGVGSANAGSATFTDVSAISEALGGSGGASTSGAGGAGGNAIAAGGVVLVRGSPVVADSISLVGFGLGGDGGTGATTGAGGFGAAGNVNLTASQRFQRTERGSATIGSLSLLAFGEGGSGSTQGASYYAGDGGVSITQSDVTIGGLSYANSGLLPPPPSVIASVQPIKLVLSDATLTVDTLAMSTPGEFLLDLNNAQIDAASISIDAGTFVLPAAVPANPGTVTATDFFSLTATGPGGAVRSYASFVSQNTASVSASDSIVLGDIETTGLFEASSQTGSVTVGNIDAGSANLTAQGNVQAGNVTVATDFSASSGIGSVVVGTVDAQTVDLRGTTDVTAARINAAAIDANAGGTLNVTGVWTSPAITISANDIEIPATGALSAGATGFVDILTTNAAGAFVGDGLTSPTGFRLGNAEFGRISGNQIFLGVSDRTNEVDLTIGALTLSSSQLPGLDGEFTFATGNSESFTPSGRIRVDGAVTGSGFSATQYLGFATGSFELNAETGSIALAGSGPGGLGGIVEIEAANIHFASPAILTRLRTDPRYAGVADELNAPAATQRPEGVLRALGVEFFPSDTLYIQNTGTATNSAGFYVTQENSDIEPPGFADPQAPDVDVIINGRFATATGDVTGRDVQAAIVEAAEDPEFPGFSATSQVNGCALSGEVCGPSLDETPELAVLQSEIELLSGQTIDEDPFDIEETSEEEEEEAKKAAAAPIEPPVLLIDTRPLNPPVDIVDPVSGSGNPASLAQDTGTPGTGDEQ